LYNVGSDKKRELFGRAWSLTKARNELARFYCCGRWPVFKCQQQLQTALLCCLNHELEFMNIAGIRADDKSVDGTSRGIGGSDHAKRDLLVFN